ncbi:MAG TPA: SIR2 family protein [Cyclobacteriaceae bacterium]|nr:SIR2 family protein [Cyclobacteriaceae bacterium]HMV07485.1 SIR2 family protein [Cyclobacteriaceae bacterium]HMW99160.1 SIR2 family protein [Cyclobacteriaceae bacterium]HMX48207.1 SIR2 family protein [Cyclobacteriaceae bacterium]HMY95012.1 SIR2 family protein [Cyclobacteriaceae bacterium]
MKKKLLVVVGAGASRDFGMPTVSDIDKLFDQWALKIFPLGDDLTKSLYTYYKDKVHQYYQANPNNRLNVLMNFEHLLFGMQQLQTIALDREGTNNRHLNAFIVDIEGFPEILHWGKRRAVATGSDFGILHGRLVDNLLDHLRDLGRTISGKQKQLDLLKNFFAALRSEFELGIVNLNYDNVILSVCPELETGFDIDTGEFDKQRLLAHPWNFHYQLHGSIHFDMVGTKSEMHKIFWNPDLSSTFQSNSSGRNDNMSSEGNSHLNSSIIAGLDKTNQLVRDPFMSYYSQTVRAAFEADSILFLGYGFSDKHLNKCIAANRFDKKKRKVVVIDYAEMDKEGLEFRTDSWAFGLHETVPYNAHLMNKGGLPKMVYHFRRTNTFQSSSQPEIPLSVWYNGLLEACQNKEMILAELLG